MMAYIVTFYGWCAMLAVGAFLAEFGMEWVKAFIERRRSRG